MRKNFALLGATIVVCLVARPALASDENIGQSFIHVAMAIDATPANDGPMTTAAIETSTSQTAPAKPDAITKPKVIAKKRVKKRTPERLVAKINLSSQTMNVMVDGKLQHSWKISSGAKGHHTPTGSYKPYYMTSMHYSKKYDNAPMPHSVFFRGGYAVHATGSVRRLGSPASHGCVRLSPGNARKFFKLVQRYKKTGTRIKIAGSTPASRGFKKRYARNTYRANRRNSSGWTNFRGYSDNYVSYNRRRANTRRIKVQRRSNGSVFGWQF